MPHCVGRSWRWIVQARGPGFVANRIQMTLFREALACVEEGLASAYAHQFAEAPKRSRWVESAAVAAPRDFADVDVAVRVDGDAVWRGVLAGPIAGVCRAEP